MNTTANMNATNTSFVPRTQVGNTLLTVLRQRIVILEKQLRDALLDKQAAELVTQHVTHLMSKQQVEILDNERHVNGQIGDVLMQIHGMVQDLAGRANGAATGMVNGHHRETRGMERSDKAERDGSLSVGGTVQTLVSFSDIGSAPGRNGSGSADNQSTSERSDQVSLLVDQASAGSPEMVNQTLHDRHMEVPLALHRSRFTNFKGLNGNCNRLVLASDSKAAALKIAFETKEELGLFFRPEIPTEDMYSTIVINNIDPGTHIRDLLSKIRGGSVFKISLLDTVMITNNSLSALVTFFKGSAAKAYVTFVEEHGVVLDGRLLEASVVGKPTHPPKVIANMVLGQVPRDLQDSHSRCLEVENFPLEKIKPLELIHLITMRSRADSLVSLVLRDNGVLEIHFSSVQGAQYALEQFRTKARFLGCKVKFAEDPCGGPIEQLMEKGK